MKGRADSDTVSISVIVPTIYRWPTARATLDSLLPQLRAAGGELVLVVTDSDGLPPTIPPAVRTVVTGATDVFEQRAAGIAAAAGDLVAVGEDHVVFEEGWVTHAIAAFDSPEVAGSVGSIRNGAAGPLDRACFWVTLGPWFPPLPVELSTDRTPVPGNVVLRREVAAEVAGRAGALEYELLPRLLADGVLRGTDGQRAVHDQSMSPRRALVMHFASGRSYGAAASRGGRAARLQEAAKAPLVIFRQTAAVWASRGSSETRTCRLLVATIAAANGLGQVVGILRGTGSARRQLD